MDLEDYTVTISVDCSKGTYIRTLCEDIGIKLGVGAYMNTLLRTRSGIFTIDDALTTKQIEAFADEGKLENALKSVDGIFSDMQSIHLNPNQTKSVVNGVQMTWRGIDEGESVRVYDNNGKFLCISQITDGKLKLQKSFW